MNRGRESEDKSAKARKAIPARVVKILFAKSGGRCGKCNEKYYTETNGDFTTFYRICHIRGVGETAARHDPEWSEEHLNEYENLFLLCSNCHDEIDAKPDIYTIDVLLQMKQEHELTIEKGIAESLIQALSGPAGDQLTPIPVCLKTLKQIVSDTKTRPEHMRTGKPVLADFESGTIVRRDSEITTTFEALKIDDISQRFFTAILTGESGSGKTTLGLHIGLELRKRSWLVLYVDAEFLNLGDRETEIVDYLRGVRLNTLVIIDNINGSPEAVETIVQSLERLEGSAPLIRVLMTGRMIQIKGNPIRLSIETFLSIYSEIPLDMDFGFAMQIAESIGIDVNQNRDLMYFILQKAGNNLPLVGTALLQLHETGEVDWARLSNYAMNRRLVNLRFTKKKTGEIALLLIAVFTRMHCLVSLRFITKVLKTTTLSEPVDVVEQLVMEGHVISQMLNREVLLDVGHPSMANLLLDHFGNELYQGLKEEPMKSSGNLENLETEIWIDYLKQPAPNLSTFLVNLSSGLIQYQRYRPALELLKAIEEMEPDDASLSIGLTNIGVILDNSGRMTESKRAYELALELDESSGFTWANLGNLLCHMQDLSGARSAHEKASSLLPDLGLIHSQLGNVLSDLREFDAAENAHELAINLEPENPLIWSNMGAFYTDKKLFKKSLQAYHKAVEIDELWIDAWIGLAKVYHMLSRKKEARKAAAKAIRIEPKGFFHFLDLGALFTVLGRVDLGQEAIENALRIYPNSGEALLVLSETLKQSGRLEEFENYYQRARPLESSSPGIFISIGNTLMDLDEFNLAIDMYESALKLDPGSGEALYRIALIKGMQGELDAAEVFFSEALKSGYDVETVSCDYANLLIHTGTPKKAVEVLSKFLEENESANGLFILGRARTLLGDGEGAIKAYKDAIKIQPDFYQAWYNLGNCFLRKKNLSWAERAYRKALSINRQYTKARTLLAQVLHWMGKSEQGLRELRKAVKNNPGNPVVYNNLASALFAMGRREEAIKYGKMASEIAKSEHQKLHELVDFQLDMLFGDDDSDSLQ